MCNSGLTLRRPEFNNIALTLKLKYSITKVEFWPKPPKTRNQVEALTLKPKHSTTKVQLWPNPYKTIIQVLSTDIETKALNFKSAILA
jgi:hypothetical protein